MTNGPALNTKEESGITIGIDLAKNVFEIYVEDEAGQVVERRRLSRKKMLPWFANRPRAVVGMEACGGAHYWVRELEKLGHEVRLIAPQYMKPWVQTNPSDPVDAWAICRAARERGCGLSRLPVKRSRRFKSSTVFAVA